MLKVVYITSCQESFIKSVYHLVIEYILRRRKKNIIIGLRQKGNVKSVGMFEIKKISIEEFDGSFFCCESHLIFQN